MRTLTISSAEILPRRSCGLATEPGSMSQRSCVYFGTRYVLGPIKEAVHIVHGAVGCSYYGKMVRGTPAPVWTTDMQEHDVIFGAREKLKKALLEAFSLDPSAQGAFVYITCVSGLIGEDVTSIAEEVSKETGKPVKVVSCPGFSAYSQSKGHSLAYQVIFDMLKHSPSAKKPTVNLIGEYNVGGETKVIKELLAELGVKVHVSLTGDASWSRIEKMTCAHLNLMFCGATAEDFCKKVKKAYGIPYMKVSFYGLKSIAASLRKIAAYFDLPEKHIEKVIAEKEAEVLEKIFPLRRHFVGKKALVVLGAYRIGPQGKMLKELGFEVLAAASIFGRGEDHEEAKEIAPLVTDNPGDAELEEALWLLKPDIVLTNAREQWRIVKLGVPVLSFPQPKDRGPYAGYVGMANFARDIYRHLKAPVWNLLHGEPL
ncbi:nitrogenase component 1 [Thermodesulfatator atlanticus]|uniref:nitrogenase component 1 n=1 Tax=Thermodesulfatator atlanticus TaxID=501497 RepID=UPI0003B5657F|nr:nitrogenase component 1 [Thermodesulfatator atlanticus]